MAMTKLNMFKFTIVSVVVAYNAFTLFQIRTSTRVRKVESVTMVPVSYNLIGDLGMEGAARKEERKTTLYQSPAAVQSNLSSHSHGK